MPADVQPALARSARIVLFDKFVDVNTRVDRARSTTVAIRLDPTPERRAASATKSDCTNPLEERVIHHDVPDDRVTLINGYEYVAGSRVSTQPVLTVKIECWP